MILDKDSLIRELDALGRELGWMGDMMRHVTEVTRGDERVETDNWCEVEYAGERLTDLIEHVANLRRDVVSDL